MALIIDGEIFAVEIPQNGIKRSASILDGPNAGRVRAGDMQRDLVGTYYNYTVQVDTNATDPAQYDRLYEKLTAPVDSHQITLPYGQGEITFEAYVANVEDSLVSIGRSGNLWGGLSFTFTAMSPRRRPGE